MGNGQHEQDMLCGIKCSAGLFRFPVAETGLLVRTTNEVDLVAASLMGVYCGCSTDCNISDSLSASAE
jgi:hypothetical protein